MWLLHKVVEKIPDTSKLPPILCKHFPSKIIRFLIPLNNIYVGQTIKSNIWETIRLCQQEISQIYI